MKIKEALKLNDPILITFIGGGGKTTTLFRLGEELSAEEQPILLTTTTSILMPPPSAYDLAIVTEDVAEAIRQVRNNENKGRILLGKNITTENKLKGFLPKEMDRIYKENRERWFLVEGDGSNGRSLKIPEDHEPQVPSFSSITVILIGADILGKEINKENVHRHHLIQPLTQRTQQYVDKSLIFDLISHPLGITKGIPEDSKKVILFNKISTQGKESLEILRGLSEEMINEGKDAPIHPQCRISSILLGEVQDKEPIIEIVGEDRWSALF